MLPGLRLLKVQYAAAFFPTNLTVAIFFRKFLSRLILTVHLLLLLLLLLLPHHHHHQHHHQHPLLNLLLLSHQFSNSGLGVARPTAKKLYRFGFLHSTTQHDAQLHVKRNQQSLLSPPMIHFYFPFVSCFCSASPEKRRRRNGVQVTTGTHRPPPPAPLCSSTSSPFCIAAKNLGYSTS